MQTQHLEALHEKTLVGTLLNSHSGVARQGFNIWFVLFQQGYYMNFDSIYGKKGTKAQLVSYRYYASDPHCKMSFWYYMAGTSVGSLAVKLKLTDKYEVLYKLNGSQGESWKNANLSIGARKDFEIIFEASRGKTYDSKVALDDIKFYGCFAGR